ncbi:MAG: NTP transferase domain-containing protein, partial [Nanoarchaeota archaeon]|nr:NTP transferase domain-containing protein [Nanoarchaeota archaeon]
MQAVILAAGKSTRTYPLTLTKPKPLLKILNKPILAHLLDALLECGVKETIVVVGYKKEMIVEAFGDSYRGMNLVYAEQKEQLGTLHALHSVKDLLKGRFILLYGDDIPHPDDIKEAAKHRYCAALMETKFPERFGIAKIGKDGFIEDMVEKPQEYIGNLAGAWGYALDKKIFEYPLEKKEGQKEFYIPDAVRKLCKDEKVFPLILKGYWLPTGYPWALLDATEIMIEDIKESNEGEIEKGAVVKGKIVIGKGTVVRSGAYIEGPVVIGKNCTIG